MGAKLVQHPEPSSATGTRTSHRSQAAEAEATITCSLLSCSHGKVNQPCSVGNYPGIIVQSAPGQLACDPSPPSSFPVATSSPPPAPNAAPVGQAQLSSSCTPGTYDTDTGTFYPLSQTWPSSVTANEDIMAEGYQITLTNHSQATADIDGFAVVFYDHYGTEITSDQESFGDTFLPPGQSLTWTEHPFQDFNPQGTPAGPFILAPSGAVDAGDTCSLVQWYTGQ